MVLELLALLHLLCCQRLTLKNPLILARILRHCNAVLTFQPCLVSMWSSVKIISLCCERYRQRNRNSSDAAKLPLLCVFHLLAGHLLLGGPEWHEAGEAGGAPSPNQTGGEPVGRSRYAPVVTCKGNRLELKAAMLCAAFVVASEARQGMLPMFPVWSGTYVEVLA